MDTGGWDEEIDARGLRCPLPVLRAQKRLGGMAEGRVLRLRASDPMALIDLPHFCREAGHELLSTEERAGEAVFRIRRGPAPG